MSNDFDIDKIAKLAVLKLTDEQKETFTEQLPQILEFVGQLQEVDTSSVDTRVYLTDQENVFRKDEVESSTPEARKACIEAFPQKAGDALQVPGIFE